MTPADIDLHARLGIPPDLLVGVRRVTDVEARDLLLSRHPGDLAGVLYSYVDPDTGHEVTRRLRRDHPEIEGGQPKDKYLSAFGDRRHLYFPPTAAPLLADTSAPVVFIEAEKSALAVTAAAARAGRAVLAIACGGCWGWRGRLGKTEDASGARVDEVGPLPDLDRVVWTGREAIILFDANAATNPKVQAARRALAAELTTRRARVRIVDVPPGDGINGPDDFIGRHGDAAFWALLDAPPITDASDEDRPRRSQATRLVDLAFAAGVELWHTPAGEPYITIPTGTHREHHAIIGRALRDWLARLHHRETGQTPGAQAITDASGTLAGTARYDGAEHAVSVRVAGHQGAIYLDLGGDDWRVVEITAAGWRLLDDAPVRFRRPRGLLALQTPLAGGSVDALRGFVNVRSEDDWRLIVAWLVGALKPSGPYPLLALTGEQGTAKSTTARLLRRLVDPSIAELRAEPREIRDLMIAASSGWFVALDNLSHVQPWLSDALCRISTGGALSTRQLYTDGDEHFIEAIRPVILTSITDVAIRGDLQDRALAITLPPVPEAHRRCESDLWREFRLIAPAILGALLDAACCALRRERDVRLDTLPRMADWAVWTTAAEPALGWPDGAVLAAYTTARQQDVEAGLDGDPLAVAIRALTRPWEGTAAELLTRLTPAARAPRGWPESPRGLASALRRLAPQLRRVGIEVDLGRRVGHDRRRVVALEDVLEDTGGQPSAPSAPSFCPDLLGDPADGHADATGQPGHLRPQPSAQPSALFSNKHGGKTDAADADGRAPLYPQEAVSNGDGYCF